MSRYFGAAILQNIACKKEKFTKTLPLTDSCTCLPLTTLTVGKKLLDENVKGKFTSLNRVDYQEDMFVTKQQGTQIFYRGFQ